MQHGLKQVGINGPLMHLVQHHGADSCEFGIALQPAQQHACGDELHPGGGADAALTTNAPARARAHLLPQQLGEPSGSSPRRKSARLGHNDAPRCAGSRGDSSHEWWNQSGLARSRRCMHDHNSPLPQSSFDRGQDRRNRECRRAAEQGSDRISGHQKSLPSWALDSYRRTCTGSERQTSPGGTRLFAPTASSTSGTP